MKFEFVKVTESDKKYLLDLRKKTMVKHLESAGLPLSEEEHLERLNYKYDYSYLVFLNKVRIGFVKYFPSEKELELIQIQIEPRYQSKGYGAGIVQEILSIGKDKTVKLSVLKDNPAVELYKRLGFKIVSEDKYAYLMKNEH